MADGGGLHLEDGGIDGRHLVGDLGHRVVPVHTGDLGDRDPLGGQRVLQRVEGPVVHRVVVGHDPELVARQRAAPLEETGRHHLVGVQLGHAVEADVGRLHEVGELLVGLGVGERAGARHLYHARLGEALAQRVDARDEGGVDLVVLREGRALLLGDRVLVLPVELVEHVPHDLELAAVDAPALVHGVDERLPGALAVDLADPGEPVGPVDRAGVLVVGQPDLDGAAGDGGALGTRGGGGLSSARAAARCRAARRSSARGAAARRSTGGRPGHGCRRPSAARVLAARVWRRARQGGGPARRRGGDSGDCGARRQVGLARPAGRGGDGGPGRRRTGGDLVAIALLPGRHQPDGGHAEYQGGGHHDGDHLDPPVGQTTQQRPSVHCRKTPCSVARW